MLNTDWTPLIINWPDIDMSEGLKFSCWPFYDRSSALGGRGEAAHQTESQYYLYRLLEMTESIGPNHTKTSRGDY